MSADQKMNQTQAISAGKYAQRKICMVLNDLKSLLQQANKEGTKFVVDHLIDKIKKGNFIQLNFEKNLKLIMFLLKTPIREKEIARSLRPSSFTPILV